MRSEVLPIEITVGALARLTGLTPRAIRWQADHGGIPHRRKTANPRSPRVILVTDVERLFPAAYEALIRAYLT